MLRLPPRGATLGVPRDVGPRFSALAGAHYVARVSRRRLQSSAWRAEKADTSIGQLPPQLSLTFTCTVPECDTRQTHEFSRDSYKNGVVLVQCPGCKNRHLIADNLGWFTETPDQPRTIEDIVREKGGRVRRGTVYADGEGGETIEIDRGDGEGEEADRGGESGGEKEGGVGKHDK
ncbi:hypothetical protein MSPP1_002494 [Malassezia sp. CBS 17886]|nr:hypothetical protein MSPP1_002494 [Malassezia sp. CBS 17886]